MGSRKFAYPANAAEKLYENLLITIHEAENLIREDPRLEGIVPNWTAKIEALLNDGIKICYPKLAPTIKQLTTQSTKLLDIMREEWLVVTENVLRSYWVPSRLSVNDLEMSIGQPNGLLGSDTKWKEPIVACIVHFFPGQPRKDNDNRVSKWMVDALYNTWYIPNDTCEVVDIHYRGVGFSDNPHTELWISKRSDFSKVYELLP